MKMESEIFEDIPIPYKMILKHFGSHENTIIEFGKPNENCFFQGSSGRGKTHIIRALQCALGNKPNSDKEIFTSTDISDGIENSKEFCNETNIELIVKNSGKNHLECFPKDAEITVGVYLNRENPRKNHWYTINHEEIKERCSKEKIQKIFGNGKDPLLFIPQGQTDKFILKSPQDRFDEVSQFIGIEDSKSQLSRAENELQKANKKFIEKNHKYETQQSDLKILKDRYDRYLKKVEFKKNLSDFKEKLIAAEIHEFYSDFQINEQELHSTDDIIQEQNVKISQLKKNIEQNKKQIEDIEVGIEKIQEKKAKISTKNKEAIVKIENHKSSKKKYLTTLQLTESEVLSKNLAIITQDKKFKEEILDSINAEKYNLSNEENITKKDLMKLKKEKKFSLKIHALKIKKIFSSQGIPSEFLFETLEFKTDQKQWANIIEAILSKSKKGIVVPEKFQIKAEKISRENGFDVIIFSPRHKYAIKRAPNPSFRNWKDILNISPKNLESQDIEDIMNFLLGNIYFPNNPKELEEYRKALPSSNFACLDGYYYTIYSQNKINTRNIQLMIGKGAIEYEINRLNSRLKEIEVQISLKNQSYDEFNVEYTFLKTMEDCLILLKEESNIEKLVKKQFQLADELRQVNQQLRDPEGSIKEYRENLARHSSNLSQLESNLESNLNSFKEKQQILQEISKIFNEKLTSWNDFLPSSNAIDNIDQYFINYQEELIEYTGILIKIQPILKKIPQPVKSSSDLEIDIARTKSAIEQYSELSKKDEENYKIAQDEIQRIQKEITEFSNEINRCNEQFKKAENQLLEQLSIWREKVSKIFTQVMKELELDGEIDFQRGEGSTDFQLNLKVANQIGGAKELIESSNFSGGEKQRTAVAFMVAIISQSNYPYVVWDEFDSHVGDDIREKIANVVKKFFSERKLIALSPQDIVKGYARVFPRIYEVWKNDDGFSRISEYIPEKLLLKKGVLDDAF